VLCKCNGDVLDEETLENQVGGLDKASNRILAGSQALILGNT
jgi:hypothetical protein